MALQKEEWRRGDDMSESRRKPRARWERRRHDALQTEGAKGKATACVVAKEGVEERRRLVASQTKGVKGKVTACGITKGGVEAGRRHVGSQTEGVKGKVTAVRRRVSSRKEGWRRGDSLSRRKPRA